MKIRFHVTEEAYNNLTFDAQIAFQDVSRGREPDYRGLKDAMAAFLVDEKKAPLEYDVAMSVLGKLRGDEIVQAGDALFEAVQAYMVPKENGNSSSSLSTTEEKVQAG